MSCAKCFTPVSYQARLGSSGYFAEAVINIQYVTEDKYSSISSLKRGRKPNLFVACESCNEIIATQDKAGIFYFTDVIPSNV